MPKKTAAISGERCPHCSTVGHSACLEKAANAERERMIAAVNDIVSDAFRLGNTDEPSIIIRAGLAKLRKVPTKQHQAERSKEKLA